MKQKDKAQRFEAATEFLRAEFKGIFVAAYKDLENARNKVDDVERTIPVGGDYKRDAEFRTKINAFASAARDLMYAEAKVEFLNKVAKDPKLLRKIFNEAAECYSHDSV